MHMKINGFIFIVAILCFSTSTFAGGYRVALQGQNAAGMAHTGVAVTDSAEAVFFNPAGMSFLDSDKNFSGGVTLINSITEFENQTTNTSAENDNPLGTPFYLYYAQKYNEKVSLGFGVYTPYGNSVVWEKSWAGSHLVNDISLKTIYFQPTASYQINNKLSIGFGPILVRGSVEFNRDLNTSLVDANDDRSNVTIDASGIYDWGYNIGVLIKPVKSLSLGISYRSKVVLEARDEDADFDNIPGPLGTTFPDTTYDADLVLPAELTLGVSYLLGTRTLFAFDVNRTFWGAYENLNVEFKNGAGTSVNKRNYSDANIFRIGVQHKATNVLTVRGGAYLDKTPIEDGFFTPETPRNDAIGLTAGASYAATKRLSIDISFLYLRFDEFSGSYDHYEESGSIIPFGGEYKSTVSSIGLGVSYQY